MAHCSDFEQLFDRQQYGLDGDHEVPDVYDGYIPPELELTVHEEDNPLAERVKVIAAKAGNGIINAPATVPSTLDEYYANMWANEPASNDNRLPYS